MELTHEQMEDKVMSLIVDFNNSLEPGSVIFLPSGLRALAHKIKDTVYECEEEELKEEFAYVGVNVFHSYLSLLNKDKRITEEIFKEMWEEVPQVLFMYMDEVNKVSDIQKTMVRFLVYIESNYEGQDPRTTCAPEAMLAMFEYSKKIVKLMCDTSTARILEERLRKFALQDTLESASNGKRNSTKYNITIDLLKSIGSSTEHVYMNEEHRGGRPYETNEFDNLIPLQDLPEGDKYTEDGEDESGGDQEDLE